MSHYKTIRRRSTMSGRRGRWLYQWREMFATTAPYGNRTSMKICAGGLMGKRHVCHKRREVASLGLRSPACESASVPIGRQNVSRPRCSACWVYGEWRHECSSWICVATTASMNSNLSVSKPGYVAETYTCLPDEREPEPASGGTIATSESRPARSDVAGRMRRFDPPCYIWSHLRSNGRRRLKYGRYGCREYSLPGARCCPPDLPESPGRSADLKPRVRSGARSSALERPSSAHALPASLSNRPKSPPASNLRIRA